MFLCNYIPSLKRGISFKEIQRFFFSPSESNISRLQPRFQEYSRLERGEEGGREKKFLSTMEFQGEMVHGGREQSGPRIVDCPIDTILGEIKGEKHLSNPRMPPATPARAIKHIFVPDKFPTSKSYFYFACMDKNLDFSFFHRRIVRFRHEKQRQRERERNGSRKRKKEISHNGMSVYR